jgi:hypothetical protein
MQQNIAFGNWTNKGTTELLGVIEFVVVCVGYDQEASRDYLWHLPVCGVHDGLLYWNEFEVVDAEEETPRPSSGDGRLTVQARLRE